MTARSRPAGTVVCSCPKGWHLSFVARERCKDRPEMTAGMRALKAAGVDKKRGAR